MASKSQIEKLKSIDDKTKYLIFGYNRNLQSQLATYTLFQNVPDLIHFLCILYYLKIDEFEIVDPNIYSVSNNGHTIKCDKGYWKGTAYGSIVIPSTSKFNGKWTIKLDECVKERVMFGISSKILKDTQQALYSHNEYPFYCYSGYLGYKIASKSSQEYGEKVSTGDIIDMHLIIDPDSNKQQLSFCRNGTDFGIAFDEIETGLDIEYRFAVSMYDEGDEFTIVDFRYLYM